MRAARESQISPAELHAARSDGPLYELRELEVHFEIRRGFFSGLAHSERRHVHAVDGISLQLARGEILALVGESGCGKTTVGRALLRLEAATGGEILYKGLPLSALAQA